VFYQKLIKAFKRLLSGGFLISLLLWDSLGSSLFMAGEFSTIIKKAHLERSKNGYKLVVESDYHLSVIAIDALQSSIPLYWCLQVDIERIGVIWDDPIFNQQYCYTVQYHALLKTYRVTPDETHQFHSLTAAFAALSKIERLEIIKHSDLQAMKHYRLMVQWQFDRETLPVPLRVLSYFDDHWNLSSEAYEWILKP
jgi:hypothetical protein